MILKEMESNGKSITPGKPICIGLPSRHESPRHCVPDTSHVPLRDIARLCVAAMLCEIVKLCDRITLKPTVASSVDL